MAKDIIDLLIHVGWLNADEILTSTSGAHELNIISSSMGGMIVQELALILPPNTINMLTLASTFSRFVRTEGFFETLLQQINLLYPRGDIDTQLDALCSGLFAKCYLDQPDTEADELLTGGTEGGNFPTVRDRLCAVELRQQDDSDEFGLKGPVLQMVAAAGYHKSRKQQQEILAQPLRDGFGVGVEFKIWDGAGHVLFWEKEHEFNSWLEARIEAAVKLKP